MPVLHKLMLALCVTLVSAELGVRLVDARAGRDVSFFMPPVDQLLSSYQTHPYMGYSYPPGFVRKRKLKKRGQDYHINSLGFRGAEIDRDKPPGHYRILCMGGSTTFGTGVSEDHKTYPARLQHYLDAVAPEGMTYEVINCGVSGFNTAENLIYLQLWLVELDPDAVVIYQAANDARPIQARGFRPDYAHYRRSWVETKLTSSERWLVKNLRLYAWATRGLDPEEQLSALSSPIFVEDFRELHVPSTEKVFDPGVDVFFRNLRHMIVIARDNGILPVLSTFAMCREKQKQKQKEREHFLETVAAINQRLVPFAEQLEVPLLDVAGALGGRCELFGDWMHLGDEGSDHHGRVVAEEAQRLGLFGL